MRIKDERKNYLVKIKEMLNKENGVLKTKEVIAMNNRELHDMRRKKLSKKPEFNIDLWGHNAGKIIL